MQRKNNEIHLEQKQNRLLVKFPLSKNTYKVNDIFTDHIGSIIIKKIKINYDATCMYEGIVLKKDGTPTKKQEIRKAHQSNEKK